MATLPEHNAPELISPAILASLDEEAQRAGFAGTVCDFERITVTPAYTHDADWPTRGRPLRPRPQPEPYWLVDLVRRQTHPFSTLREALDRWSRRIVDSYRADPDRAQRWLDRACLAVAGSAFLMFAAQFARLAIRAVL